MSASLVGSEMCIRDRGNPEGGPGINLRDILAAPGDRGGGEEPSPRAVSYTHLTLPTICSV
eukprot:1102994-Alexandrium_andersonii.AAC.1